MRRHALSLVVWFCLFYVHASGCDSCHAAPQSGFAFKQELLRSALNAANQVEERESRKGMRRDVYRVAGKIGDSEFIREHPLGETRFEVGIAAETAKAAAIRGHFAVMYDLLNGMPGWTATSVPKLFPLNAAAASIAFSDHNRQAEFKKLIAFVETINEFPSRFELGNGPGVRFEKADKERTLDELRFLFAEGLIKAGHFLEVMPVIESIEDESVSDSAKARLLQNFPLNKELPELLFVTKPAKDYAKYFGIKRLAKQENALAAFQSLEKRAEEFNQYFQTELVFEIGKTMAETKSPEQLNKELRRKIAKRVFELRIQLNKRNKPGKSGAKPSFGGGGGSNYRVTPVSRFAISDMYTPTLREVLDLCIALGAENDGFDLANESKGDERELWLRTVVQRHLDLGEWQRAEKICIDYRNDKGWGLFLGRDSLVYEFVRSVAREGDYTKAAEFIKRIKRPEHINEAKLILAAYQAKHGKQKLANETIKEIVSEFNTSIDDESPKEFPARRLHWLLDVQALHARLLGSDPDVDPMEDVIYQNLIREFQNVCLAGDFDGFSFHQSFGAEDSDVTRSLLLRVHRDALRSVPIRSKKHFAIVTLDLAIRNAVEPKRRPAEYRELGIDLSGSVSSIIEYASSADNNSSKNKLLFMYVLAAAEQGNESVVNKLIEAIPKPGAKAIAMWQAAELFPPVVEPLAGSEWSPRSIRTGGVF